MLKTKKNNRYVAIDFEKLDTIPISVCSIGLAVIENNKITDKEVDFYFNRVNSKLGMYSIIKTDNEEVIKDYEKLKKEAVISGIDCKKVISFFTYTRSSTAIENDTAKDNSLRITRVIKHYSPLYNFWDQKRFLKENGCLHTQCLPVMSLSLRHAYLP